MKLIPTPLVDSYIIKIDQISDFRGFFARSWDKKIFEKKEIKFNIVQSNISFNKKKGTLRGMHYQTYPYQEAKLVRCTKGRIYDVIVDLRPKSRTFLKWYGIELSEKNHLTLYVPKGFAHGFQTLENNTELFYQMSQYYNPRYAKGIMWNDDVLKIKWPLKNPIISKKDSIYSLLVE